MKAVENRGGTTPGRSGPTLSYECPNGIKNKVLCSPSKGTILQFIARNPDLSRLEIYAGLGFSSDNERHRPFIREIRNALEILEVARYLEKPRRPRMSGPRRYRIAPRGEKVIA